MIDVKTKEQRQESAPPMYQDGNRTQPQSPPQPQWQGQGQGSQYSQPTFPHTTSGAEIGAQYRNAQFAQCAMGNHQRTTKYGMCGIITAVIFFPIGLICLFLDTEKFCTTCGTRLS